MSPPPLRRWTLAAGIGLAVLGCGSSREPGRQPGGRATVARNPIDDLVYALVPAGSFEMGCSPGDPDCGPDELPRRRITLRRGYWLGTTEVTVAAFARFAAATGYRTEAERAGWGWAIDDTGWARRGVSWRQPGHAQAAADPVVLVSWHDAAAYCRWSGGRLPSEAEWEHAARAGTEGPRYGRLAAIAWTADDSGRGGLDAQELWGSRRADYAPRLYANGNRPHPVGGKNPNAFGLYDMLGNVWEWVGDRYGPYDPRQTTDPAGPLDGPHRVLRGGSWDGTPRVARASCRTWNRPSNRYTSNGFRCARERPPAAGAEAGEVGP